MDHIRATQSLRCTHCQETVEIPRGLLHNPERHLRFVEMASLDHRECAEFPNVRLAQLNRQFVRRMKREMRAKERQLVNA
jgi:hypothetical protein